MKRAREDGKSLSKRERTIQKKDWTQTISFGKTETPQQLRTLVSRPREAKKSKNDGTATTKLPLSAEIGERKKEKVLLARSPRSPLFLVVKVLSGQKLTGIDPLSPSLPFPTHKSYKKTNKPKVKIKIHNT